MKEPEISVGIVSALEINLNLNNNFTAKGETVSGPQNVTFSEGGIMWNGNIYHELTFTPAEEGAFFSLHDVTIGLNFHWERKETQSFTGTLKLVIEEGKVLAINILPVEDYLVSVISSEMSATSSLEFLKAHAVISRSWLLAQIDKRTKAGLKNDDFFSFIKNDKEYIRWYDREDHTIFDVCADDHCQRYQGITRASSPTVAEAIRQTCGQVLTYDGHICDARFSKCCGGITEEFQYCWQNKEYPYLKAVSDDAKGTGLPDLTQEAEADRWIRTQPHSRCNTKSKKIISQILNSYDRETNDFYRWKVKYSQEKISELINGKSKIDFGDIIDLIPVERGTSGRISRLKIVGSNKTLIIGKELEIRRILSDNHLFSSAFVVDKGKTRNGIPQSFTLTGAGWGHGVGLCQIGAAVMGEEGYSYRDILLHYYQNAEISRWYE